MSALVRQAHRWLSMAFTAGFVINAIAYSRPLKPPVWVNFLAVVPIFLLLATGLYMFVLPHARKWRGRAQAA